MGVLGISRDPACVADQSQWPEGGTCVTRDRAGVQAFATAMPRVRPFYAVKCNPDPVMLRTLAALGCGFDCASAAEVNVVLAAGAAPGDIIMAQACKRPVDLRAAVASGLQVRPRSIGRACMHTVVHIGTPSCLHAAPSALTAGRGTPRQNANTRSCVSAFP